MTKIKPLEPKIKFGNTSIYEEWCKEKPSEPEWIVTTDDYTTAPLHIGETTFYPISTPIPTPDELERMFPRPALPSVETLERIFKEMAPVRIEPPAPGMEEQLADIASGKPIPANPPVFVPHDELVKLLTAVSALVSSIKYEHDPQVLEHRADLLHKAAEVLCDLPTSANIRKEYPYRGIAFPVEYGKVPKRRRKKA